MGKYCYDYPRPAVTVDAALLQWQADRLAVLLIRRGSEPFAGRWALPGGFVEIDEPLEAAARRELAEETAVTGVDLRQLAAFGDPGRDPRGWTISVAFWAVAPAGRQIAPRAGDDASRAAWCDVRGLPPLAFDHDRILECAVARLRVEMLRSAIGFDLAGPEFTLPELQQLYETVLGRPLETRRFRRQVLRLGVLEPTPHRRRSATVYRVVRERLIELGKRDFCLSL